MYILDKPTDEKIQVTFYENDTLIDVEGNEVHVPKAIGCYSIENLEEEKFALEKQIADVNYKLSILNS